MVTKFIARRYASAVKVKEALFAWRFIISERSLYAIARPSVCLSVVCLSVTFVRPTQAVQIFGHISTALGTLAIR